MRVGIHAGSNSVDEIAARCREAGVNEIFLKTRSVPGAFDRGYMTPDDFRPFRDLLQEREVQVSGMIAPVPSKEAVLGENESELDALCRTLRAIGRSGIDVVLFYPLDRLIYFHEYHPGRPLMVMPGEEGWDMVIRFFRRVVGAADEVSLKLANHLWAVDVVQCHLGCGEKSQQWRDLLPGDVSFWRRPAFTRRNMGHGADLFLSRSQPD